VAEGSSPSDGLLTAPLRPENGNDGSEYVAASLTVSDRAPIV
jgi:hypothetical protein